MSLSINTNDHKNNYLLIRGKESSLKLRIIWNQHYCVATLEQLSRGIELKMFDLLQKGVCNLQPELAYSGGINAEME